MGEIRDVLASQEAGIHNGKFMPGDYKAPGALIEERVATTS